jgi:hypothetical protein
MTVNFGVVSRNSDFSGMLGTCTHLFAIPQGNRSMTQSTDNTARFWAYSNYLNALARLIEIEHPTQASLVNCLVTSKAFQKINHGPSVDYEGIAKALRLSWYTEILLYKTIPYQDILPYATPWSMVQTYYAIYPTIRAYFKATGRDVGKSHESTLKTIGADLVSCKGRFPHPWACVYDGDPADHSLYLSNYHIPVSVTLTNPLRSPYNGDPWQHYGLFLKTTRDRCLARKIENWKKENNRKAIRKVHRALLLHELRPTNIFDALYRVRARSNYRDIDSFAFTSIQSFDYQTLQMAMCRIVDKTLLVFESMIAKAIGRNRFRKFIDEFSLTPLGNNVQDTYLKRWNTIEHLL